MITKLLKGEDSFRIAADVTIVLSVIVHRKIFGEMAIVCQFFAITFGDNFLKKTLITFPHFKSAGDQQNLVLI